jgi:lipopolysaccharide exporter
VSTIPHVQRRVFKPYSRRTVTDPGDVNFDRNNAAGLTRIAFRNLAVRHAAALGFNLVGSVVLARQLGPALWGSYAVSLTALLIGQQAVERGASGFIIQRAKPLDAHELTSAFVMQIGIGAIVCGILLGVGQWISAASADLGLVTLIEAVALSTLMYAIRAVPLGRLERALSYGRVAAVEVTDVVAFNLVAVLTVLLGFGIAGLAVATVIRASISTAIALAVARTDARWPLARRLPAELLGFAVPFTGSNLLTYLNTLAAPILVAGRASLADYGVLQLAYTIIVYPQTVTTIASRVGFATYPRMTSSAIAESASQQTGALIRSVASTTLILAVTSAYWVVPIFGTSWTGMTMYMLAIAPTYALGANFNLIIAALNARSGAFLVLTLSAAFSALYWLGGLTLVPAVGGLGLPVAYSIATVVFAGYLAAARKRIGPLVLRRPLSEYFVLCVGLLTFAFLYASDAQVPATIVPVGMIIWLSTRLEARRLLKTALRFFPRTV